MLGGVQVVRSLIGDGRRWVPIAWCQLVGFLESCQSAYLPSRFVDAYLSGFVGALDGIASDCLAPNPKPPRILVLQSRTHT